MALGTSCQRPRFLIHVEISASKADVLTLSLTFQRPNRLEKFPAAQPT